MNGDGIITNGGDFDDRAIMGSPFPDFTYGITNGTTVGGGNVTGIERDWINDRFVADASYFNIRNITLGFTIPKVDKYFKSARVYGSIQNVHIFTKYWGGPNPEISVQNNGEGDGGNLASGVDISGYPVPRIFSLGLNLNF